MSPYRKLWALVGAMTLAALLFLGLEAAWRHAEAPTPPLPSRPADSLSSTPAELLDRMFVSLDQDPNAASPQTREAVEAAAELADRRELVSAETLFAQGLRAYGAGDLKTAEAAYRRAIAEAPDWSWPYTGLGITLSGQNRLPEAERAFRKAIDLDPNWSRPRNDLSILLRTQGRIDEAEQHARKAIELDPQNPAVYNNYGNLLVTAGDYEGAEDAYLHSIDLNPDRPAPYFNLASLYALQDRRDNALETLAEALRRNPDFADAAREEQAFAALRDDARFQELVDHTQERVSPEEATQESGGEEKADADTTANAPTPSAPANESSK